MVLINVPRKKSIHVSYLIMLDTRACSLQVIASARGIPPVIPGFLYYSVERRCGFRILIEYKGEICNMQKYGMEGNVRGSMQLRSSRWFGKRKQKKGTNCSTQGTREKKVR
ncbi:hypothetical protein SUGI_1492380 [Cryptomeria japonica]|uniref:Uncharacterized protein n=1 Tax=Cryptomeria japonica TaxID=3369 RepID=A0AAD3RRU5_CRYJA|nr:hypothetical protein SUGI_1492380 [Cryptomeria japonica]